MPSRVYPNSTETHVLREIGLEHLSHRPAFAKTFTEWKQDVRGDFGSCDERRLYRQLTWLIANGAVCILGGVHKRGGGTKYYRLLDQLPGIPEPMRQRCTLCGRRLLTYRSHIDERFHRWFRGRRPGRGTYNYLKTMRYETLTVRVVRRAVRPPGRTSAEMSTLPQPGASLG